MMSEFSLIILVAISVLYSVFADDDGHHHHVIIHVPYKIHTVHHIKHIHHQKKGADEKYEVLGYTIGKPIDLSHQLGSRIIETLRPRNGSSIFCCCFFLPILY
ncbi:uncharacterized protein LOC131665259 isoform X2 [Phymastichus coffea]|uniref:uncharacterized protein LOC131665259 isoform X2 n=1 Tax=Phymastichus coffea TaxID=108790 RepID=UPI00273B45A1|nr:uncharacterized protein LOC131665259 isoform X2 [Phymastichus coffea]